MTLNLTSIESFIEWAIGRSDKISIYGHLLFIPSYKIMISPFSMQNDCELLFENCNGNVYFVLVFYVDAIK